MTQVSEYNANVVCPYCDTPMPYLWTAKTLDEKNKKPEIDYCYLCRKKFVFTIRGFTVVTKVQKIEGEEDE